MSIANILHKCIPGTPVFVLPEVYMSDAVQIQLNGITPVVVQTWPKNFGHIVGFTLHQDELAIEVLLVNNITVLITTNA